MSALRYRRALTIAGSDSGGGAGIQADLKVFAALGVYGASAITALTAQNTLGVQSIQALPADFVRAQIHSVLGDIGADAVKIGMLERAEIIEAVAEALASHPGLPIVLDPVMVAKGGAFLLRPEAVESLRRKLLPRAAVLTPNLPEAEALLGRRIESDADFEDAARDFLDLGCQAVYLKGGHREGPVVADYFRRRAGHDEGGFWLRSERVETPNVHGTGCSLASAIAAFLARGYDVEGAARSAHAYLARAVTEGARYRLGAGHGPVHHFAGVWP